MAKKGLILLLIITVLMAFTSCGLDYSYSLDESLHYQIEVIWGEDDPSHIIYQGEKYMFVGTRNVFCVDTYDAGVNYYKSYDDVLLSWNGYRYIWYIDEYYSYTSDSPVFIYNKRLGWVYFREDYNYFTDIFIIDNTNEEIVFEDIFGSKQDSFDFVNPVKICLSSKQYPRIKTYARLGYVEGQWYISWSSDSREVWIPSDEFMEILFENGLV